MKRIIPLTIILLSVWLLIFGLVRDDRGEKFSVVTQSFDNIPVLRATAYHEKGFGPVRGAIYDFESFQNGKWTEITSFRHDDPNNIPSKNLKIENKNLLYFWFNQTYGVSTDGGKSWSVWNVERDKQENDFIKYLIIENVKIELTGRGKMIFDNYRSQKGNNYYLVTENFGKNWYIENK